MVRTTLVFLVILVCAGLVLAQTAPSTSPAAPGATITPKTPPPPSKAVEKANSEPRATIAQRVEAEMPADAAKQNLSGRVIVEVEVDTNGAVLSAKVLRADPKDVFDAAALTAAKKSTYKPAMVANKPVKSVARIPYTFGKPDPKKAEPAPNAGGIKEGNASVPPMPTKQVKPDYPKAQLEKGVGGKVTVSAFTDSTGKVINAKVAMSEPKGVFDSVCVAAALQWTFKPRMANNRPVPGMMQIPFIFDPKTGVEAKMPVVPPTPSVAQMPIKNLPKPANTNAPATTTPTETKKTVPLEEKK